MRSQSSSEQFNCGVYLIRNTYTNEHYVGVTARTFRYRWQAHKSALRRGKHTNPQLQYSFNEHGIDVLEFSVLEVLQDSKDFRIREQYWIDYYRSTAVVLVNGQKLSTYTYQPLVRYTLKKVAYPTEGMKTLREYRRERYQTVQQFASFLGVTGDTVYRIQRGETMRYSTIKKIASRLKVQPTDITEFAAKLKKIG